MVQRPGRPKASSTTITPRGPTWTPTATGTTSRVKATCGRLTRLPARDGTLTAMGTGCGRPASVTSGSRATPGATCLSNAERGITTTSLAGAGPREWEWDRAARGGEAEATAEMGGAGIQPSVRGRTAIASRCGRTHALVLT